MGFPVAIPFSNLNEGMVLELGSYFTIIRKNWMLILLTVLLVSSSSVMWSMSRTPQYEAKTQLFVSVRTGEASAGDLSQGSTFARQAVSSYVSVVSSAIVVDRVASELKLSTSTEDLAQKITAESPANTVLINIGVTDYDPRVALEVANKTAEVFAEVVENELEAPAEGSQARVRIDTIEPATLPDKPVGPGVELILVFGLLMGFGLGVAFAVLRTGLDTRIRSKANIETLTDLPIVGMIGKDPKSEKRPLIALKDPRNPLVESFRTLRTNLSYLNVEDGSNTLLITSAGPNEGKTTTAVNLAIVMADSGARVALVDADLRKPSVAKMLGIEGGAGLSDLLVGKAKFDEVLQQFGRKQLTVLPAGRIPPNPSELLGYKAMGKVLDMLSEHFDYVIVDAPPALAVTDAAILSKKVGGTLLIAAAGKVRKQELSNVLESLETVDGKVLGIVVTMVPTKGPDSYSYSSYSYRYYGSSGSTVATQEVGESDVDLGVIKI